MKNPLGQLAITALLALVALAACSGNSLSDYSDQVDHVMDAHYNEFAIADAAFDDFLACMPQALSEPAFIDCNADFVVALNRYERVSLVHMEKWVADLRPPDEALRFHELTHELFQLRLHAFNSMRALAKALGEDPSFETIEMHAGEVERSADLFDRADRLFVRILAEARKLGWYQRSR